MHIHWEGFCESCLQNCENFKFWILDIFLLPLTWDHVGVNFQTTFLWNTLIPPTPKTNKQTNKQTKKKHIYAHEGLYQGG